MSDALERSFGAETVASEERRARIRRIFSAVAGRYDLMNDVMSFSAHRLWKRRLAEAAAARDGETIVDLAGGTGDIAIAMAGPGRRIIVCDPSLAMMTVGRRRGAPGLVWVAGEAEALPFADNSLDGVTISFGIRNVTRLERALAEILRVLKPGGRMLCLEFSTPRPWFRPFYHVFSFAVIPRLGAWIAGAPEAYRYLVESIRRFPDQEGFKQAMEAAGFDSVTYRDMTFGVVSLHIGLKSLAGAGAVIPPAASRAAS